VDRYDRFSFFGDFFFNSVSCNISIINTAINKDRFVITDLDNHQKEKPTEQVDWTKEAAEKGGFPHFMLKEIFEQPEAVKNSIRGRLIINEGDVKLGGLQDAQKKLRNLDRLFLLGMGTARNAALVGEYMLEEYAGIPVEVEYASEFSYRKSPFSKNTAVLAVSQSGETADTLIAIKEAKKKEQGNKIGIIFK
jgi:glucosamine--fructose-6-phosphate aminotransferase (isomerizing)